MNEWLDQLFCRERRDGMLVRKYIHQRLQEYYAQPFDRVVGSIPTTSSVCSITVSSPQPHRIPFRYLLGEYHWKYIYGNIYRNTSGQWLTPSELFSPYYGQCMALWMIQQIEHRQLQLQQPPQHIIPDVDNHRHHRHHHSTMLPASVSKTIKKPKMKIEIVELGGGRGTNAIDILEYIYQYHYETIYTNIISYTILDGSLPLLQHQNDNVTLHDTNRNTKMHTSIFQNRYFDLYDYVTTSPPPPHVIRSEQQLEDQNKSVVFPKPPFVDTDHVELMTIVIGLEILDNLPQDKIRVTHHSNQNKSISSSSSSHSVVVEQAELQSTNTRVDASMPDQQQSQYYYEEVYVPLTDSLLQHVLQHYPLPVTTSLSQRKEQYYWIPTIACGMIHSILKERPNALLLFADFDCFMNVPPKTMKPTKHVAVVPVSTTVVVNDTTFTGSSTSSNTSCSVRHPIPAMGEPIVTDMNDTDLISYLHTSDTATDILFPTNFPALATFIQSIHPSLVSTNATPGTTSKTTTTSCSGSKHNSPSRSIATVQKQYDFLQWYGPQQVQATTSCFFGYSPMIHDFENCSILTFGYCPDQNDTSHDSRN